MLWTPPEDVMSFVSPSCVLLKQNTNRGTRCQGQDRTGQKGKFEFAKADLSVQQALCYCPEYTHVRQDRQTGPLKTVSKSVIWKLVKVTVKKVNTSTDTSSPCAKDASCFILTVHLHRRKKETSTAGMTAATHALCPPNTYSARLTAATTEILSPSKRKKKPLHY